MSKKLVEIQKFQKSSLPIDINVDKTLTLERCKKGPCLKLKKKGTK